MPATKNLKKISKAKCLNRKRGQLFEKDQKLLEKLYTQGPTAYGSIQTQGATAYGNIQNVMKASRLLKYKVETFFGLEEMLT